MDWLKLRPSETTSIELQHIVTKQIKYTFCCAEAGCNSRQMFCSDELLLKHSNQNSVLIFSAREDKCPLMPFYLWFKYAIYFLTKQPSYTVWAQQKTKYWSEGIKMANTYCGFRRIKRMYTHGRRKGGREGLGPPWILKFSAKKVAFSASVGKIEFHHFWPPWKNLGNIP